MFLSDHIQPLVKQASLHGSGDTVQLLPPAGLGNLQPPLNNKQMFILPPP